jgi:hypothetical protein
VISIYTTTYGYTIDMLDESQNLTRLEMGSFEKPADERVVFNFLNESKAAF